MNANVQMFYDHVQELLANKECPLISLVIAAEDAAAVARAEGKALDLAEYHKVLGERRELGELGELALQKDLIVVLDSLQSFSEEKLWEREASEGEDLLHGVREILALAKAVEDGELYENLENTAEVWMELFAERLPDLWQCGEDMQVMYAEDPEWGCNRWLEPLAVSSPTRIDGWLAVRDMVRTQAAVARITQKVMENRAQARKE